MYPSAKSVGPRAPRKKAASARLCWSNRSHRKIGTHSRRTTVITLGTVRMRSSPTTESSLTNAEYGPAVDLLLIRHGLPERIEGADGPADPVLTTEGRRQAERLADWLAHEQLDH